MWHNEDMGWYKPPLISTVAPSPNIQTKLFELIVVGLNKERKINGMYKYAFWEAFSQSKILIEKDCLLFGLYSLKYSSNRRRMISKLLWHPECQFFSWARLQKKFLRFSFPDGIGLTIFEGCTDTVEGVQSRKFCREPHCSVQAPLPLSFGAGKYFELEPTGVIIVFWTFPGERDVLRDVY